MDNPMLPGIFVMAAALGLLILLWTTVLPMTKERLKKPDQITAKLILFLFSLPLAGLVLRAGFDIINSIFSLNDH